MASWWIEIVVLPSQEALRGLLSESILLHWVKEVSCLLGFSILSRLEEANLQPEGNEIASGQSLRGRVTDE